MAFADDLLSDAYHLAKRGGKKPKQASLRRAVSTAYYALFHLLIADFVSHWKTGRQRATLARIFQHGRMKDVSQTLDKRKILNPTPTMIELKKFAVGFVRLQQARHDADYDNSRIWSTTDVNNLLTLASDSLKQWRSICTEDIAQDYLMSMLDRRQSGG